MDTDSRVETEGPAQWSLRLGGLELGSLLGGERLALPGKRERVLLAYLASSPNFRQTRRKAMRAMRPRWTICLGDSEHRLISSQDGDIVLDRGAFRIDVLSFRRLAAGPG